MGEDFFIFVRTQERAISGHGFSEVLSSVLVPKYFISMYMCNEMLRTLITVGTILSATQTAAFQSFNVRLPHSPSSTGAVRSNIQMGLTFKDLRSLSVKEALNAICGPSHDLEEKYKFPNTDIAKKAPTVCTYVIANPKAFFEKPRIAKAYGIDMESITPNTPLEDLAKLLPVVYIADVHTEYGTLGYQLNKRSENTMNDIFPELRSFRQTPVFLGGQQNKGSSFTMVHNKVKIPY